MITKRTKTLHVVNSEHRQESPADVVALVEELVAKVECGELAGLVLAAFDYDNSYHLRTAGCVHGAEYELSTLGALRKLETIVVEENQELA